MHLSSLRKSNVARQAAWPGGEHCDLGFRGVELAGETGEALNKLKKYLRASRGIQGKQTDNTDLAEIKEALAEELADIVICVDLLAMDLDIDLDSAVPAKFNRTSNKAGIPVFFSDD